MSTIPALSIKNLSKTYSNGVAALKGIDLQVEQGDFFGLLGPNGAGKSTAIGIICSLINRSTGDVSIFGHDLQKAPFEAKVKIGLVPQEFNFNIFEKAIDILVTQAGYYGINLKLARQRGEYYLDKLGIWDKRNSPPRALSGGMKRRLMIARALIHHPQLLILDEPTAGVDIELRRMMWQFLQTINQEGTTIILTTHYLEEAEALCRNIAIINQGEIVAQAPKKDLLAKLNQETIVLDLSNPTDVTKLANIKDFKLKLQDECTLEVNFTHGQSLNDLFQQLSAQELSVLSMRNKTNRLEELFVDLIKREHNE